MRMRRIDGRAVFRRTSRRSGFQHALRRTITEIDNVLFSSLTHDPALLHLDEEYCRTEPEFGQRLVNSAFTLGLMVGISVGDTTLGTAVANLGWDEVRFPLDRGSSYRATARGSSPRPMAWGPKTDPMRVGKRYQKALTAIDYRVGALDPPALRPAWTPQIFGCKAASALQYRSQAQTPSSQWRRKCATYRRGGP